MFGRLPRPAKRSFFALSSNTSLDKLNCRSRTMDRVQPLFFKVSINRCHHYFKALWFVIFTFFIVYFGVEMLEQSVKLSRLIIFYFISNFLLYAPILPNREPKTNAFRSIFVLEQFFSSSIVVSVAKANVLTPTIAVFARNWFRADPNFCAI